MVALPADLQGVHHIGVAVEDLDAAAALLEQGLGMVETLRVRRPAVQAAFFAPAAGGTAIELIRFADPQRRREKLPAGEPARLDHVAFAVADVDATFHALQALGVTAVAAPQDAGPFRSFFTTGDAATQGLVFQFLAPIAP
jgi:catechol 2,3-dioxygenase-like lactoylglutathione lyase family enzyme